MKKVLVVDDNSIIRRLHKIMLNKLNLTDIIEAENGDVALNLLNNNSVDIIILDWYMPVMNGFDCLKVIRDNSEYNGIKVIMCTCQSNEEDIKYAFDIGANEYLTKPFNKEDFAKKILN